MKKYININKFFLFLILSFLMPLKLSAAKSYNGVITGNIIRIRRRPKINAYELFYLNPGTLVQMIKRTDERDMLNRYPFGYYWYLIREPSGGRRGWIYGKDLYLFYSSYFYKNKWVRRVLERNKWRVEDDFFRFRVAKEQAYPVSDKNGLTGSTVHGMPVLIKEGEDRALFLWVNKKRIKDLLFRWDMKETYRYQLLSNQEIREKVAGIRIMKYQDNKVFRLTIDYFTKNGSGRYQLIILPEKNRAEVIRYYHIRGKKH